MDACRAQAATTIAWQVINQLYNVGVNHCNRNPSNPMSQKQILGRCLDEPRECRVTLTSSSLAND